MTVLFAAGLAANDPAWLWLLVPLGLVWFLLTFVEDDPIKAQDRVIRMRAAWKAGTYPDFNRDCRRYGPAVAAALHRDEFRGGA